MPSASSRLRCAPPLLIFVVVCVGSLTGCVTAPSEQAKPVFQVLTRRVAETYLAYEAGDCASVLERTSWLEFDPRGSEVDQGELLVRGFCLELSGDLEAATALYEQLSTGAPLSFAALDARERLQILERWQRDPEYAAWVEAAPERADRLGKPRPPIDRVSADFPPVPHALGLDGYAVVEFGVTPDGQTDAPIVVDAQPPLIFEGSALRAVRAWRYTTDPDADRDHRQVIRIVFKSPRSRAGAQDDTPATESTPD